jgi:hypothetical protein
MASPCFLTVPIFLCFLEPFTGSLLEKRPNPNRNVERLPRSQAVPGNQSSRAFHGLPFLELFRRPSCPTQTLALDRYANLVSQRVSIDLGDGLPAQLLPQTQPKLIPGVLQAPPITTGCGMAMPSARR